MKKAFFTLTIILFFTIFLINFQTYYFQNTYFEKFKLVNNQKIPYMIYKTGPLEIIPPEIKKTINNSCLKLKANYKYYNNKNCYRFIKKNYNHKTLLAYNSLIPTAYKADLWRFCVLYLNGGIYSDFSQEILQTYDVNADNCDMLLVKDLNHKYCQMIKDNIQISFMAVKPKNIFFKYVIDNLTIDILNKRKGICILDVTGPVYIGRLFKKFFNIDTFSNGINYYVGLDKKEYKINIFAYTYNSNYINLINGSYFIKNKIKDHQNILYLNNNLIHYSSLWNKNLVFNKH